MKRIMFFASGVIFSFTSIAAVCIIFHQPLIFRPVRYNYTSIIPLFILMMVLNLGLVLLVMEPLRYINQKKLHLKGILLIFYFTILSLIALYFFTLLSGYSESFFAGLTPDPYYYYTFSNNSWIYIFCGSLTVILVSFFYANEPPEKLLEKLPEEEPLETQERWMDE